MKLIVNNTNLNIAESGVENRHKSRASLIFLHYFAGSSQAWTETVAELADDFHCIAPDLRGFGVSDAAPKTEYLAVENYAADVANLISLLGIENYTLIGHSMGGKIALAFAAKRPRGLQSLILLAPSPPTAEPIKDETRTKLLSTRGNARAAAETIRQAVSKKLADDVFERSLEDNLRTSETAWKWWLESGSREDISFEVEKINVPVLVAAGANDEAMTPELLNREIVCRLENALLTIIPKTKHLLPLEAPAAIAALIRNYCHQ